MGRRSREKRERQNLRAELRSHLEDGEAQRRQLVAKVQALPRAIDPADVDARTACEALALACEALRTEGHAQEALALAAAGERRTITLQTEETLAALAVGEDETAKAAAQGVPELERLVEIVRAAQDGRTLRAAKRDNLFHRSALAAAKAVTALREGKEAVARKQRSVIRVPSLAQVAAALEVETGRADDAYAALSALQGDSELMTRGVQALGRRFGRRVLEFDGWPLPPEHQGALMMSALAASFGPNEGLGPGDPVARFRLADALAGLSLGSSPAALIYQGFGLIPVDPREATALFERALGAGGDLAECFRGMMLAAQSQGRLEVAGRSAARLARHLAGLPGGRELGVAANLLAMRCFADTRDARVQELRGAIQAAAKQGGLLDPELDARLEALALLATADRDQKATELRAEALLAEHPQVEELWDLRLRVATPADTVALRERAHAATGLARFKSVALPSGPGLRTPGAVAAALSEAWDEPLGAAIPAVPKSIADAQSRLAPADRALVDLALVALLAEDHPKAAVARTLTLRSEGQAHWLTAAKVCLYLNPECLPPLFAGLAPSLGALETFRVLYPAGLEARAPSACQVLLSGAAGHLPGIELREAKEALQRMRPEREPDGALGEAHDRLHPEFCLYEPHHVPSQMPGPAEEALAALLAKLGPKANLPRRRP